MSAVRMRVLTATGHPPLPEDQPAWLASWDIEAHDGQGSATFTFDPDLASTWPDMAAAIECWRQISVTCPRRPDGQPNRPLTAITIEVEPVPERPADIHVGLEH